MNSINQQKLISELFFNQIKNLTKNTAHKSLRGVSLGNSNKETSKTTPLDSETLSLSASQTNNYPLGFELEVKKNGI